MPDEMFLSRGSRALVKGKRRECRTRTKRLIEFQEYADGTKLHRGIVLDLNAYSLRIRSLVRLPVGTPISIDMRWSGAVPANSQTLQGRITRTVRIEEGQFDLGVELRVPDIRMVRNVLREAPRRRGRRVWPPARMHVVDFVVGGQ